MSDNCCRVIYTLYHVLFPRGEDTQYLAPIHDGELVLIRRLVEKAQTSCDCEQMAWVISDE